MSKNQLSTTRKNQGVSALVSMVRQTLKRKNFQDQVKLMTLSSPSSIDSLFTTVA